MNDMEKPFSNSNEGCQMNFTDENPLTLHQKKNEMALHLGLKCSNNGADQTPTPTRFIRNCEEVGLFQDLQNVNPFEETFRKAVESGKSGTLHVPETSDDTLHTPHIFPHIESNSDVAQTFQISRDSSLDENLLQISDKDVEVANKSNSKNKPAEIIVIDDSDDCLDLEVQNSHTEKNAAEISSARENVAEEKNLNIKEKIKNALLTNKKTRELNEMLDIPDILVTEVDNTTRCILKKPRKRKTPNINLTINSEILNKSENANENVNENLKKRRALNRAAQIRSRQKKKYWLKYMEEEIKNLHEENKNLCLENRNLKNEVKFLKSMLLLHKECSVTRDPKIAEKIQELISEHEADLASTKLPTVPPAKKYKKIMPNPKEVLTVIPAVVVSASNPLTLNPVTIPNATTQVVKTTISNVIPVIQSTALPKITPHRKILPNIKNLSCNITLKS